MAIYRKLVIDLLHALNADRNQTAGAQVEVSADPAYSNDVIWSAVLDGEAEIVRAILEAPQHARKAGALIASATVANNGALPAHIGRILAVIVDNQYAEAYPVSGLTNLAHSNQPQNNPLKLPIQKQPLYGVTGDNRLIFTGGTTATVQYGTYTRPSFTSFDAFKAATMLCPDEYLPGAFFCAMKVIGHEGNHLGALAAYYERGQRMVGDIRGAAMPQLRDVQRAKEE